MKIYVVTYWLNSVEGIVNRFASENRNTAIAQASEYINRLKSDVEYNEQLTKVFSEWKGENIVNSSVGEGCISLFNCQLDAPMIGSRA